jgi:hypothetical protein
MPNRDGDIMPAVYEALLIRLSGGAFLVFDQAHTFFLYPARADVTQRLFTKRTIVFFY